MANDPYNAWYHHNFSDAPCAHIMILVPHPNFLLHLLLYCHSYTYSNHIQCAVWSCSYCVKSMEESHWMQAFGWLTAFKAKCIHVKLCIKYIKWILGHELIKQKCWQLSMIRVYVVTKCTIAVQLFHTHNHIIW